MNLAEIFAKPECALPENLKCLKVRVPGSTANLGPGFDTLALAYKIYCTIEFRILEKNDCDIPLITLGKHLASKLPEDKSNLIYKIVANQWQASLSKLERLRIHIESEIPLARGLGSSAAAITGAIWAAHALSGALPDNDLVLSEAEKIEGHADNAAASLLGGLVISSARSTQKGLITEKLNWPESWASLVFVPPYELSTKKARSVLPESYSRQDSVHNFQGIALLLAAIFNHDENALQEALSHDRFHEPYRAELVPELNAIKQLLTGTAVLGCVLSGAGPSVLIIVKEQERNQITARLEAWRQNNCPQARILDLNVDNEGLMVSYE